mmetsp:Transcript_25370/g.39831  ORF Transcript_25370/g.39831 Transcript_25370/m.39831 type:complete len:879 (+) Transcript_25370:147-2783(+)
MAWSCSACTYRNINAGAKACHMCGTPNANAAVVDLTSPKPTQYGSGGDVMESNRSRRRRLGRDGQQHSGDKDASNRSNEDVIDVDLDETMNKVQSTANNKQRHSSTKKRTNDDALTNNEVQCATSSLAISKRKRPDERKDDSVKIKRQENGNRKFQPTVDTGRLQSNSKGTSENNRPAMNDSRSNNNEKNKRSKDTSKRTLTDFYNQNSNQPAAPVEILMESALHILQSTFKLKSLRPLQQTAIQGALGGNSQIVIMATGGGKSLCYQLPTLAAGNTYNQLLTAKNSRVTIVVCPLIALMVDQVNNLMKKGVMTAACWSSSHSAKEKAHIMKRLSIEKERPAKKANTKSDRVELTPIQMLYVTPELIETQKFRDVLLKLHSAERLFMFAIDEAHCLSTWGHDFRPAYRKLSWISESLQNIPIMACTGTATEQVINDIRSTLGFRKEVPCHLGTFNRPNIEYKVKYKDSLNTEAQGAINDLIKEVKNQHVTADKAKQSCAGIIYVHKREDCLSLATQIYKSTGILAAAYHAGLKDVERDETQRKWCDGKIKVAVATVAFGMGIDLPHVRYVIHWTMSKSLEGFYQESGRAGRDGLPSQSILYYSKDDASKFTFLVKKNSERARQKSSQRDGKVAQKLDRALLEIEGMVNYCIKPGCKRQYVLSHFGEKIDPKKICKKTCDYCLSPRKVEMAIQASDCASAVVRSQQSWQAHRKNTSTKKYHHNPTASDESLGEYESDDGFGMGRDEGLLGITSYARDDEMIQEPPVKKGGFLKASSVLKKYETLECQQGNKNGFINFKTRTIEEPSEDDGVPKKIKPVTIPAHLRAGLPDPLAGSYTSEAKSNEKKSSSQYASEAERLKQELEELNRKRAEARARLGLK